MPSIVVNGIIYFFVTLFFIIVLIYEKKIGAKIKDKREIVSEKLVSRLCPKGDKGEIAVLNYVQVVINVIFFLLITKQFEAKGLLLLVLVGNIVIPILKYKKSVLQASFFIVNIIGIVVVMMFVKSHGAILFYEYFIVNMVFYGVQIVRKSEAIKKCVDVFEAVVTAVILVLLIQHFYIGNFLVPTTSMVPTINPGNRLFANMVEYKFVAPKRGQIIVFREPMTNKQDFTKRIIGQPGETVRIGDDGQVYINGSALTGTKYDRLYYQMGALDNKTWTIPKKGDTIQLKNGSVKINGNITDLKTFEHLQDSLKNDEQAVADIMSTGTWVLNGKTVTGPCLDLLWNKKTLSELEAGKSITLTHDYYFMLGDNSEVSLDSRFWGFVSQPRIKGHILFRFFPINTMGFVK